MENPLCKYKNIFGKPGEGIRTIRVFGIAVMDTVVTIIAGYLISLYTGSPLLHVLAILFIMGIIAHRLFCVRTGIDKMLFPDN